MTTNYNYTSGIEMDAVLKAMGIDDTSNTITINGKKEKVIFGKGLKIYFSGTYYVVVKGKIPLEVANIIYAKYPDNPYGIRIEGGCDDYVPMEHAVDDEFIEEIKKAEKECHNFIELDARYKKAEKKMAIRNDKDKYIKLYHVDSKEGLIILLSELTDYYARKQGLEETAVKNYDEIMTIVNAEMLKKLNPTITSYEWLKDNKEFMDCLSGNDKDDFTFPIRAELDEFDKTVNPFLNNDIELDSVGNYTQKVAINGSVYGGYGSGDYYGYRENCCNMRICAINEKSHIMHIRRADGFLYQLVYFFGQNEYLIVNHTFSSVPDDNKNSECLYIDYSVSNQKRKFELDYNVTQKILEINKGDKEKITPKQMNFVTEKLREATELAKTITVNNMKKEKNERKLTKQKS